MRLLPVTSLALISKVCFATQTAIPSSRVARLITRVITGPVDEARLKIYHGFDNHGERPRIVPSARKRQVGHTGTAGTNPGRRRLPSPVRVRTAIGGPWIVCGGRDVGEILVREGLALPWRTGATAKEARIRLGCRA
jgi:hypothetical protein